VAAGEGWDKQATELCGRAGYMMQRIANKGERPKTRDPHSTRHSCTLIPFAESRPGTEQNLRPAPPA